MRINYNIKIINFVLCEPLAKNISTAGLEAKHKFEEANGEVSKLVLEKCNRVFSKNIA